VCYLEIHYSSALPKKPNNSSGRLYQISVNHGFIVYGTLREVELLHYAKISFLASSIFALAAGLINAKYGDFLPWGERITKPMWGRTKKL
jgi:hypothetical protein